MPIQATIARRIREERLRVGLTQSELGARLGIGGQAVHSWEVGERFPRAEHIDAMAGVFGIEAEHMYL